jgi:RNA polymerase sigma factor (sigma-70 family)
VCKHAAVPGASDGRLIERLRQRDEKAWRAVVDRYERLVWSIPLEFGLNRDDAAEIAQITFTELLNQLDAIRSEESIGAWLATVARRQTWRRATARRREVLVDEHSEREPDAADWSARIDDLLWLDAALAELRPRCRALVAALYLSGREPSYEAVSAQLDMPIGSIGPTRERCLANLKRILRRLS